VGTYDTEGQGASVLLAVVVVGLAHFLTQGVSRRDVMLDAQAGRAPGIPATGPGPRGPRCITVSRHHTVEQANFTSLCVGVRIMRLRLNAE
jgi:hypothetical protein